MTRKKLFTFIAVLAAAVMVNTAQAAFTGTLGDLASNGGILTIGDKTFSNFDFSTSLGAAADLAVQAAALTVTASIVNDIYYLSFIGAIVVDNSGGAGNLLGDLVLSYRVTASPGWYISMIDQQYTGNALPGSGQIIIGETAANLGGVIKGNSTLTLNPSDLSDPFEEAGDNLIINPPEQTLDITKDILITAYEGQIVGLSVVKQSFHQVPEPATMIAGALLLLPFGASALRIIRSRKA